jgi:putative phosphoesterase
MMRVGLISDTHGQLRPQALEALRGCDRIVHGGDIGGPDILGALGAVAPVVAVRGNNDRDDWAQALPDMAFLQCERVRICVVHDLAQLDADLESERVRVVVSGHSHKPRIDERAGVLYVNPGSAGPRRFTLPIAVALLDIDGDAAQARIVLL